MLEFILPKEIFKIFISGSALWLSYFQSLFFFFKVYNDEWCLNCQFYITNRHKWSLTLWCLNLIRLSITLMELLLLFISKYIIYFKRNCVYKNTHYSTLTYIQYSQRTVCLWPQWQRFKISVALSFLAFGDILCCVTVDIMIYKWNALKKTVTWFGDTKLVVLV